MRQSWDSDAFESTLARSPSKKQGVRKVTRLRASIRGATLGPHMPFCVNKRECGITPGKIDGFYSSLVGFGVFTTAQRLKLGDQIPSHFTEFPVFFVLMVEPKIIGFLHNTEFVGPSFLTTSGPRVVLGGVHLGQSYVDHHKGGNFGLDDEQQSFILPHPKLAPDSNPDDGEWYTMCGNLEHVTETHVSGDPALDPMEFDYMTYAIGQNSVEL